MRAAVLGAEQSVTGYSFDDGEAYEFLADKIIEVDKNNPQVAARIASTFDYTKLISNNRQELIQKSFQRVLKVENLSANTFEIVSKYLS